MKRCPGSRKVYRLIQQRFHPCRPEGRPDELGALEVRNNDDAEKEEILAIAEP